MRHQFSNVNGPRFERLAFPRPDLLTKKPNETAGVKVFVMHPVGIAGQVDRCAPGGNMIQTGSLVSCATCGCSCGPTFQIDSAARNFAGSSHSAGADSCK